MQYNLLPLEPPAYAPADHPYARVRPSLTSGRDHQGLVYRFICSLPRKEAWECLDLNMDLIAFLTGATMDIMSSIMSGISEGQTQITGSHKTTLEAVFLATCMLNISWPEYEHPDTAHLTRILPVTKPVYEICEKYKPSFLVGGIGGPLLATMFIELLWTIRNGTGLILTVFPRSKLMRICSDCSISGHWKKPPNELFLLIPKDSILTAMQGQWKQKALKMHILPPIIPIRSIEDLPRPASNHGSRQGERSGRKGGRGMRALSPDNEWEPDPDPRGDGIRRAETISNSTLSSSDASAVIISRDAIGAQASSAAQNNGNGKRNKRGRRVATKASSQERDGPLIDLFADSDEETKRRSSPLDPAVVPSSGPDPSMLAFWQPLVPASGKIL